MKSTRCLWRSTVRALSNTAKRSPAGHNMLRVSGARVEIDFYACDSLVPTETYRLV